MEQRDKQREREVQVFKRERQRECVGACLNV